MYCPKCGTEIQADAKFCRNCGEPLATSSVTNIYQNISENSGNYAEKRNDGPVNIGFIILSLLIPLVGFILYFTWKREQPQKAGGILIWAFVGVVVNLILIVTS